MGRASILGERALAVGELLGTLEAVPVGGDRSIEAMLLSFLLAFVLGQVVAWVYSRTHKGASYSRSFTQSLVIMTVVVSFVMFVIGNSIVTAFGLPIIAYGLIFSLWLCIPGGLIVVAGLYGWVTEHPDDPDAATHHVPGPDHVEGDDSGTEQTGEADKEVTPVG